MKLAKFAVVALGLAAFAFAKPQDVGGVLDMTGMGIYAMEDAVMDAARETDKVKAKKPPVSLAFTPSAPRRRENLKAFLAKMRTKDPKTAAGLEKLFAQKDIIAEMGKIMGPYGLRTDNVADAYALWWVSAWQASRGREMKPNRALFLAVRAQAGRALGAAMKTTRVTDATKQQVAEACLMHALLIDAAVEKAKGNPARLREIGQAVSQGARASGVNLAAMDLTPNGFVLKG
ncbi:MAG: DUF6683 family protein [Fimbriimonas sp.]